MKNVLGIFLKGFWALNIAPALDVPILLTSDTVGEIGPNCNHPVWEMISSQEKNIS